MSSSDSQTNAPPARHNCHCGKSFLRKEHLRRHQATHEEPSYICSVCSRSFTRNDLLRRHMSLHENVGPTVASKGGRACDLCHESKSRCDGGAQCPQCTKRGVPCTYSRNASSLDKSISASPDSINNDLVTQQQPGLDMHTIALHGPILGTAMLSPPVSAAQAGLQTLVKAVEAYRAEQPGQIPDVPEAVKQWQADCLAMFFGRFHERWNLVHAVTFDENVDHVMVVSSVVVTGSWLKDPEDAKQTTVKVHNYLVTQLLDMLMETPMASEETGPWPFPIYQASLLNVILAFETGQEALMCKARRLFSLLVTAIREHGVLQPFAAEAQQQKHFPGSFEPWIHSFHECWKRLAFEAFKVDNYLAILFGQPPLLRPEELELCLPTTFALQNCYGLHMFYARQLDEPADRALVPMADMILKDRPLKSSTFLIEDVQLSLCGMYHNIWTLSQSRRDPFFMTPSDTLQRDSLAEQLHALKLRLCSISSLCADPQLNVVESDFIFKAYAGDKMEDDPVWKESIMTRISFVMLNATMLYHLLCLHLCADIRTLNMVTEGMWGLRRPSLMPLPRKEDLHARLRHWAVSSKARAAILESLAALSSFEKAIMTIQSAPTESIDTIAYVTVATAAMVLQAWILSKSDTCTCRSGPAHLSLTVVNLGIMRTPDQEQWIINGGGIVADGVSLCRCSLEPWIRRFASGLSRGSRDWELSRIILDNLRRRRGMR